MTVTGNVSSENIGRLIRNSIVRWFWSAHAVFVTCAHYHQAATMYEQLYKLPPSELERRGFSHGSLARDLCGLKDSASRQGAANLPENME
jgi:hypothetical protein